MSDIMGHQARSGAIRARNSQRHEKYDFRKLCVLNGFSFHGFNGLWALQGFWNTGFMLTVFTGFTLPNTKNAIFRISSISKHQI